MKNLYLRLVARMASLTNLTVTGLLWGLVELVVRPGAEQEISRWSGGKEALNFPLFLNTQLITEHISEYGIKGRRIYSFVIMTLETTSAVLSFLFFSILFFLFALSFRNWWEEQWWKIPLLVLFLGLTTECVLLLLLADIPPPGDFFACCFVVLHGINQLAHWLMWSMALLLAFQEAKRMVEKRFLKT